MLQDALKTGPTMNTSQQEGLFKIRLHARLSFCFTSSNIFYWGGACRPAGAPPGQTNEPELTMTPS